MNNRFTYKEIIKSGIAAVALLVMAILHPDWNCYFRTLLVIMAILLLAGIFILYFATKKNRASNQKVTKRVLDSNEIEEKN